MESNFEIIPIFPIPLYANKVPQELISNHISLLDNEEIFKHENNIGDYGERSLETYILNKPEYQNLRSYILQHVTNYAENHINYNYKDYKFSQSWISLKNPNQEHKPHTHAFSLISGVLFYGENCDNTSNLSFLRSDEYSKTISSHKSHIPKSPNNFSYLSFDFYYKPNTLVLFPSYLIHSVSKNITDIPRKSLAFNIVPTEGFGSEETLTQLKFN